MSADLTILLVVHVVSATVAIGTNLTFPLWIHGAEREPEHLRFALERVRWLDRYVAIPLYAVAALSGLVLALREGIPFASGWLATSIALYVAVAALGFALYRPVSRARLDALARGGPDDPAYRSTRRQARALDGVVIAAVLVILVLMIAKPF